MSGPDLPKPAPTPDPIAKEADEANEDILEGSLRRRKGRKSSFLTSDEQTKKRVKSSLLGRAVSKSLGNE